MMYRTIRDGRIGKFLSQPYVPLKERCLKSNRTLILFAAIKGDVKKKTAEMFEGTSRFKVTKVLGKFQTRRR